MTIITPEYILLVRGRKYHITNEDLRSRKIYRTLCGIALKKNWRVIINDPNNAPHPRRRCRSCAHISGARQVEVAIADER